MFIGRDKELTMLEKLYKSGAFQFPVIYGRRRVGKTTLISRFVGKKPAIFFTAIESDAQVNLYNLSRMVYLYEFPDRDPSQAPIFTSYQQAFEAVFSLSRDKQVIFVIDEYPYLAKSEPSVSSILQALIDHHQNDSKLFLILCGSSLSFMKEQVLSEKSPLYGRRTAQIELKPLDFFESARFFPDRDRVEVAQIYGMVGGIPLYLRQFLGQGTLREVTENALLNPNAILYEEPSNLILQEVSKASRYNAVVGAIANGATKVNEIAGKVGVSSAELAYFLKELERMGLVQKEYPLGKAGKRPLYKLSDNLFRCWFSFVEPFTSAIEREMPGRAWRSLEENIPSYMGQVFEDICRQWLWRQASADLLPVELDDLGRWWGNDSQLKEESEIDIVGVADNQVVLTGECKWRNELFPNTDLDKLRHRTGIISGMRDAHLYCFSKTGFTEACKDAAERQPNTHLVAFGEMV